MSQTPEFSYASTEPFFDPIEEDIEKNQYYNDLWRKSIEERQNRPLTINEYEKWYEIAANCEMNSELQYVNYVRDYNDNYKGCRLLDNGNTYKDEPEKALAMPTLMCTQEQLISKIAAMELQCEALKEENEKFKSLLNNYQSNYAFSPVRQHTEDITCPNRPEKKFHKKSVKFYSGASPKDLFKVKTKRQAKMSSPNTDNVTEARLKRFQSLRYIDDKFCSRNEIYQKSQFYKASELVKKLDNPMTDIISEIVQ